jgi:hypothetical protein
MTDEPIIDESSSNLKWSDESFIIGLTGYQSLNHRSWIGILVPDVQYPDDPNPSAIRIEDILGGDEDTPVPSAPAPVREGLPRTFRMRADKHYVEMLDTPAPRVGGGDPAAPADTAGAARDEAPDASARAAVQAGNDLAQSLATLLASTHLLSERGAGLASTVAANLIRAEAWRATCLLRIARFLRGELLPTLKPVRTQAIVDQLLKSIEPERRLRGVTIQARTSVSDRIVSVDEDLFVTALSGLLMATIALSDEPSTLAVTVTVEAKGADVVFAISQDQAPAPSNWVSMGPLTSGTRIVGEFRGRIATNHGTTGTDVRVVVPRAA